MPTGSQTSSTRTESSLRKQIWRVFGYRESFEKDPAADLPEYPLLARASFFLSAAALEIWGHDKRIRFPETCCVCGVPAAVVLPLAKATGLFRLQKTGTEQILVPHCQQHGAGEVAKLIVQIDDWGPGAKRVTLVGLSRGFLSETRALNTEGDCVPPWLAYPEYGPESGGWRQGNGELWMSEAWSPFWSDLSGAARQNYLARWDASSEWRERLTDKR